jgi:tetratricopeptide (TPR) repeat protein
MSSWAERLSAAVQRWERGELDEAAGLLREIVVSGDPPAAREASYLLAGVLEERGDIEGARAAHRSVIESGDPVLSQRSAISLGMLLINAREWPAAHGALSMASGGADSEIAALADAALVQVFTRLGDLPAAQAALERARRSTSPEVAELVAELELPDPPRAQPGADTGAGADGEAGARAGTAEETYERGERLLAEGSLAPAEAVFRQLLTRGDPGFVSLAAFRLYRLYAEREEYDAAREVIAHAIAVGHADHLTMAHKLLGAVLFDLGEYAQARDAYRRAAEDPRPEVRLPALIEEAKLTAQLGDEDATKANFHRVIASGHAEYAIEAKACLGQMHTEAGQATEALAFWREVLDSGDTRWAGAAVTCLAILFDQAGDGASERENILTVLRDATGHPDADAAFKARQLLDHAAVQQPLADPAAEQALRDTDGALELLRAGDLAGARALLHLAIDADVAPLSARASTVLALLELGEGDVELADELLSHVADGDGGAQGFGAALFLHLLRTPGGERHPLLLAAMEHQRHGREQGVARYRAAMEDGEPGTTALATAMLAQLLTMFGLDLSGAAEMFRTAADADDPLALSYTAVVFAETLLRQHQTDEAIALLRRARDGGHPVLAPWVAHALGTALAERDGEGGEGGGREDDGRADTVLAEARAALETVLASGHPGLRLDAETTLMSVLERQGDLLGVCALHERVVAEGDPLQAPRNAWLLGFTRVRVDDLEGARAAFAQIPESHPDLARDGAFARQLLDRAFDAATQAFAQIKALGESDNRYVMSSRLTIEAAHAWQRCGENDSADRALSLMVADGHPFFAQQAAIYLGALRNDAHDQIGAIVAWEKAAAGEDEWLAGRARHGIGCARRSLGDLDGAAEAFRLAMEGEDEEYGADAARQLGEVLVEGGRVAEAREAFERLSGAGAVIELATALHRAGDLTAAMEAYREAADSADAEVAMVAAYNLALLLDDHGDAPGAVAAGERAVGAAEAVGEPGRIAQAVHNLGGYLAKAGDLERAREAFERVAVVDPEMAAFSILTLGERLEEAGDAAGARAAFERAATLDDPQIAARARERLGSATPEERAWVLAEKGDRSSALAAFTEVHGSPVIAELVLALYENEPAAVRSLLERLATHPEHAALARGLVTSAAQNHRDGGDAEGARALLELAVEFGDPLQAAQTTVNLATLTAEGGDLARAERLSLRAAECGDPEVTGLAWNNIAAWRGQRGDVAGAIEANRRAIESGHPYAVVGAAPHLAALLEERGDIAGARAALGQGSVAGHPRALECLRGLLFLLLRQQDHEAVEAAAERAVATGDPETVATGHWASGEVRKAAGDLDAAVRSYRQGIEAGHRETALSLRVELAQLLHDQGDTAAARRELEPALRSGDPAAVLGAGSRLGVWLHEEGDLAGAAEAFGRAALVDTGAGPNLVDWAQRALDNIAAVAYEAHEAGEHAVAVRALELAAEAGAGTDAVEIVKKFAASCAAGGDVATARRYYDGAMGFGSTPYLELDLAELLAEHGQSGEARAIYERLHEHEDANVRFVAGGRLLTLLSEHGDEDAAYAVAERRASDAESPAGSILGSLLGVMQNERGDTGAALRTLRAAAESGEPMAVLTLAQTLIEAGELADGREACRQVIDTADAGLAARAMVILGTTYHDEDEELAREWYLRAVDAEDSHTAVVASMYLGAFAKKRRDFAEALPWYQRVIDSGDSTEAPLAAAHLGELCYWLGDRDGAVRYYEHTLATTERPDLVGEAAYRLGEIRHLDGDAAAARELLNRALDSGDDGFAGQARELLTRLA